MKLTLTFTDSPDLSAATKDNIFNVHFEVPDDALHLIGVGERVLKIAELIGTFTEACLHISCKELDLKNHPIKLTSEHEPFRLLRRETRSFVIQFARVDSYLQQRQLKIYMPVHDEIVPQHYLIARNRKRKSLSRNLLSLKYQVNTDGQRLHLQHLTELIQQLLMLLGAEPGTNWSLQGFHPSWVDNALITRAEKRRKREQAEARKQEKAEERRKAREAKLAEKAAKLAEQSIVVPGETPKTGAGRRVGAVPGIFKGIQFRSQLEIRFAAELEERGVNWVYEAERLGEGSYLVDFYLPDYGAWVEVKGPFEARDNFLLKDVATYLKKERGQRLFVFTAGKPRLVNPSGYRELARAEFWTMLLK